MAFYTSLPKIHVFFNIEEKHMYFYGTEAIWIFGRKNSKGKPIFHIPFVINYCKKKKETLDNRKF